MSARISDGLLEQIRAANDVVDVIGAVVPLRRAGANMLGLCPFHKEKTPSFHVHPGRQIFKCFGCGKGGDVFRFIQEYENISFPEAVRELAERAKIPLEFEGGRGDGVERGVRERLLALHEAAAGWFRAMLLDEGLGEAGRRYLAERGLSAELVERFGLGYAPEVRGQLAARARRADWTEAHLEEAGLVVRREAGGLYERFRGRLIFPIRDEQGRTVGFSGRILPQFSGDRTPKYVNSPETPIFRKGRLIYGLDVARRPMLDAGHVVICEGQMDLLACHEGGVSQVVAPLGTALTPDHARILRRYVEEVVLCFDADTAGEKAVVRAMEPLLEAGLSVRVAQVPAPHDPDSFIREAGGEAFLRCCREAPGFFDYHLERLVAGNAVDRDSGRMAVVREMAGAVARTGSEVLIDTYAQKTAARLGVDPDSVRREFRRLARRGAGGAGVGGAGGAAESVGGDVPEEAVEPPGALEFWFLRLMLLADGALDDVEAHLDPAWLRHEGVVRIVRACLEAHATGSWKGVASIFPRLGHPAWERVLADAASENREIPRPREQLRDTMRRLRDQHIDRCLAELAAELAMAPADRALSILEERRALQDEKREPLTPIGDA